MSNIASVSNPDIEDGSRHPSENLELSRLLYIRDELEIMILKCFILKKEIGFHELLFWFTEYYKSYGIEDAKCMLEYVATYALYSWDNTDTKLFCNKRIALYPVNTNDPIPIPFLTVLKTLHFRKVNTAVYIFIKMFVLGSDGNGKWSKIVLLKPSDLETRIEQLCENYPQQYQKWKRMDIIDQHTSSSETTDTLLQKRKVFNLFTSIYRKHVVNIMYYLKHMGKLDWVICIDTVMQDLSDQYKNSCYDLKNYANSNSNTLTDVHALATVLFVKWLYSADRLQFQEGFVNKKKQPVIKHRKQDEEWLRRIEEIALDTHFEEINTKFNYKIASEVKEMYLSGKKTDIVIEIEENVDYHLSETLYWKQNQCTHSERYNLIKKRYIDQNESSSSSSSSDYWYVPEWIVNHSEMSKKVYQECMKAVQYI